MHLLNKLIVLLAFTTLAFLPVGKVMAAGDAQRSLSAQQWQTLTQDKAFSYKDKKEVAVKQKQETPLEEGPFMKALNRILDFFDTPFGQFLFWGVIISFVLYAAYKMLSNDSFSLFQRSKKKAAAGTEQIEEDIAETDWEAKMHEAIKAHDLRHAVRYSYMRFLQLLQNKELIVYRNDKTNYDYYSELTGSAYKQPFKQLSRQYEYAWYGHFALPEPAFNDYMQLFNTVKKQLQ